MKSGISLLSVLVLAASGAAFAQEPGQQPGAQPGQQPGAQPGQQPGAQPGQQPGVQPGQQPDVDRDRDIAAADRPPTGEFLTRMEQGHISSDNLVGGNLLDTQGEDIGDIDSLVIDEQSGEVAAVIVNVGGLAGVGARTVALPWDSIEIARADDGGVFGESYEVRTHMTQDQLENAPEFEQD